MIRVGIVGNGGMAHNHVKAYRNIRGVEVIACSGRTPESARQFGATYGLKVAKSLEHLLDSVDAVSIVTPDKDHARGTRAALARRKHVLCEKPLTLTLHEAQQVAQAAEAARLEGVVGMVNFSYRRSAALQRAIEMVSNGKLGQVQNVSGSYLQSWVAAPVWGHWSAKKWQSRLQKPPAGVGGVLGDVGSHLLDLVTAVAGEVEAVQCSLHTFRKVTLHGRLVEGWRGKKLDANDTAHIELWFKGGGVGQLRATRVAVGHKNRIGLEVSGTKGALMIEDAHGRRNQLKLCLGKATHRAHWITKKLRTAPTIYQRFIGAIQSGETAQPDLVRGAEIQAYLDACERSAESGFREDVADWR